MQQASAAERSRVFMVLAGVIVCMGVLLVICSVSPKLLHLFRLCKSLLKFNTPMGVGGCRGACKYKTESKKLLQMKIAF